MVATIGGKAFGDDGGSLDGAQAEDNELRTKDDDDEDSEGGKDDKKKKEPPKSEKEKEDDAAGANAADKNQQQNPDEMDDGGDDDGDDGGEGPLNEDTEDKYEKNTGVDVRQDKKGSDDDDDGDDDDEDGGAGKEGGGADDGDGEDGSDEGTFHTHAHPRRAESGGEGRVLEQPSTRRPSGCVRRARPRPPTLLSPWARSPANSRRRPPQAVKEEQSSQRQHERC
jgi:hypothetical protein